MQPAIFFAWHAAMNVLQVVSIGLVNRSLDIDCYCIRWRLSVLVGAAGAAMGGENRLARA